MIFPSRAREPPARPWSGEGKKALSAPVLMAPRVRTLLTTPAFAYEELRFDYGDVVLAAAGWGEWQQLERALAEGLACAAHAGESGEAVDEEALHAAVVAFRRARGLLAGEDYLHWLEVRSLSSGELREHLSRALLRSRAAGRVNELLHEHPPALGELLAKARSEAMLSGSLRAWAERLAGCAAAARGLSIDGGEPATASGSPVSWLTAAASDCPCIGLTASQSDERAPRVASLLHAERGFRDRVLTRERIDRCLDAHRLDWQRLVWQEAVFATEGAAREAALWVGEEAMGLDEVAAMAGARTLEREAYCSEVPELSGLLMGAVPGELLGPAASDGAWRLVCLRERIAPVPDDTALYDLAGAELMRDALDRHLAGRVSWNGEH
jgi:hypothetical protein